MLNCAKTVFLWKNWKKSIFVQFWGTIKNEVFQTSKPHKMTKNNFFIKKKIPLRYYAYMNHQKKFQSGLTSGSAGLRKNMRDPPPPYRHVLEFGSLSSFILKIKNLITLLSFIFTLPLKITHILLSSKFL